MLDKGLRTETAPRGRGRPPKPADEVKRDAISTRVLPRTKAALDSEAARSGRSVSQVVELWLEAAEQMAEAGPGTFDTFRQMLAAQRAVEERVGDPNTNALARDTLAIVWAGIAKHPPFYPADDAAADHHRAAMAFRLACEAVCKAALNLPKGSPAREAMSAPAVAVDGGGLLSAPKLIAPYELFERAGAGDEIARRALGRLIAADLLSAPWWPPVTGDEATADAIMSAIEAASALDAAETAAERQSLEASLQASAIAFPGIGL